MTRITLRILSLILVAVSSVSCGSMSYEKKSAPISWHHITPEAALEYYGVGNKWPRGALPITIRASKEMKGLIRESLSNSCKKWNDAVGFTIVEYIFEDFDRGELPSGDLYDERVRVYFTKDWDAVSTESYQVGLTFYSTRGTSVDEADIYFNLNSHFHFTGGITKIRYNEIDFESVLTHEIGHALGIEHSQDEKSMMYPSIPEGVIKRDLTKEDVDLIRVRYPKILDK